MSMAPTDLKFIPLSVPCIRGKEWDYVKECLDTGWVSTAGPWVGKFEQMFVERLGVSHAVSCMNGTAGLHIALKVAGVEPGTEVITSNVTFIATANAISYANAIPVVIDASLDTWQMDPNLLIQWLEEHAEQRTDGVFNRVTGRRISAIMPVHILGHSCDMDRVLALAERYDLPVIEDSTEALGGTYKGRPLGTLGTFGCYSFNGNKLITTGGGGMIVSHWPEGAKRAKHLTTTAKVDDEEFIHDEVGYNYRLTNVLAALGAAQMEQLDDFLAEKKAIRDRYQAALGHRDDLQLLPEPEWNQSALWLYTIRLKGRSSRPLLQHLKANQIQSRPLWQPMNQSPAHPSLHGTPCPNSDHLSRECLSLPCSVGLSEEDQDRVVRSILDFLG